MTRLGIVLSATRGGGTFQYVQAMLDAVLRFPENEFELTAAVSSRDWLSLIPKDRAKIIWLNESVRNRTVNRLWHASRLPNALWRKVGRALDTNVAALVAADCDLWICPSNDRWSFRAQIPALGTIHDLMHIHEAHFPEVGSEAEVRERNMHFSETCKWARGVAVDSGIGKQQLVDAYDISPERVFPLPYIAPQYIYEAAANPPRDIGYALPEKYLFYPATFWAHKNHPNLFAAIARLRERHPDIRLVLAGGKHNGYPAAKDSVAKLGIEDNVTFLGYVADEDMYELYRRARGMVMPSFFGPTNIPQLEAFVAGCPVAVSGVYGVPAQVGDAAILFDPKSVDEIADAAERLWVDDALCADLVEKGRRKAESWGPVQFSTRLQSIVETLVG